MSNGRPDPKNSRKRPERATGAPPRRASDAPRSSDGRGRAVDGERRRSEDRRVPGAPARTGRDSAFRGDRAPRREEDAEPGFGPFRGRQRDGAPGARRARGDEEARAVRSVAEEAVARAAGEERPALRIVRREQGDTESKSKGWSKGKPAAKRPAPGNAPSVQRPKIVRDGNRLQEALIRGARSLDRGYEQEALRILRPWREVHADSADLRELLGVAYYRLGKWTLAQKEIEAFVELTDSTEQHPVLMDIARALGRWKKVDQLWDELRAVSPGAEIVTEGRIVYAGALADQGKLEEAIKVLERAPGHSKRVLPHHLRLWYALADLQERAGDIPAARALFRKVSTQDPQFVDVAERLAALS